MKVLAAIVVSPHLSASGGARAGEQLSASLMEHCDITVANMMDGYREAFPATPRLPLTTALPAYARRLPIPNKYRSLIYRSDLPSLIEHGDFDLVHLHNPMPALEFKRVAHACLRAKIPYVISTHGFNEIANRGNAYGFDFARRQVWAALVQRPVASAVKHADSVLALSPADISIVREMGFTGADIPIVPNGVPSPAPVDPVRERTILEKFGLLQPRDPARPTFMFLGNHTPNKGLPILMEAFRSIAIPYNLVIGGERRGEIDYDGFVRSAAPDQRIIVTGRLQDDEISTLMRRSDLFVFPTLADTFPLVVLEAMAHGLPVVASDVGGISYEIDDGCGHLVPPGDAPALASRLLALTAQPDHLVAMGQRAKARVATHFTWPEVAKVAARAYEAVLQKRTLAARKGPASVDREMRTLTGDQRRKPA